RRRRARRARHPRAENAARARASRNRRPAESRAPAAERNCRPAASVRRNESASPATRRRADQEQRESLTAGTGRRRFSTGRRTSALLLPVLIALLVLVIGRIEAGQRGALLHHRGQRAFQKKGANVPGLYPPNDENRERYED